MTVIIDTLWLLVIYEEENPPMHTYIHTHIKCGKKAIMLCCPFLLLEENLLWHQHFSGLVFLCEQKHGIHRKGIGFERECTDEQTLIYFSLWVCDALLIGHQSGRLLSNQDRGKLMSLCRAKTPCALLLLLHRHQTSGIQCSSLTREGDFDSTPECSQNKERRNEKMG